jgi:DNA-directed RNA polymerase
MDSSDPVIASYDVCLTDSQISRYVLQYVDRSTQKPYDAEFGQKPTALRLKPKTGLVEVDIPIDTNYNYDVGKGLKYGEALKQSRTAKEGGAFGMAGGFNSHPSSSGGRIKREAAGDIEMASDQKKAASQISSILRTQTLGGRIKVPEDGDPLYMLGAFRGRRCSATLSGTRGRRILR